MDRITIGSGKFLRNMALSGLLLTSSLAAMEIFEQETDTYPYLVNDHQGAINLGNLGIEPNAFDVHVTFPYQLVPRDTLNAQNQRRPMGQDPLRNRDLVSVIENNQPLTNLHLQESRTKVWNELEYRLNSIRFTDDDKAGFKLGLAKLVMGCDFIPFQRFEQPTDCYNFVLNHLHYVIHSGNEVQQRKKAHARIWTALILTKRNIVIHGTTRQETLQQAWDLLEQAYMDNATDSTLFFQVELIVRYGLTPNGCSDKEAFEVARQLCQKIGLRTQRTKALIKKVIGTKDPVSRNTKNDNTWKMARAAFIKDLKGEVEKIKSELFGREEILDIPSQTNQADPFHEIILSDEEIRESTPVDLSQEIQPTMDFRGEEELGNVKNLINPVQPTMLRAFNMGNGDFRFFMEYDVSGYQNNCAFNCMNLTRQEALRSLLDNSGDEVVRRLIASQIVMHMVAQTMPPSLTNLSANIQINQKNNVMTGERISKVLAIKQNALGHSNLATRERAERRYERVLSAAWQFAMSQNVCEAFIRHALQGNTMMEYQRNDEAELTSIMNALAYIHHFNLEIWTASDHDGLLDQTPLDRPIMPTLQRVVSYSPQGATRTVRMRHMRREIEGQNHFTYLIPYGQEDRQDQEILVMGEHPPLGTSIDMQDEREDENSTTESGEITLSLDVEVEPFVPEIHEKKEGETKTKKRSRPELSWEDKKNRIYELHQQGKKNDYIASACNTSGTTVARVLQENFGVKKRKCNPLTKEQKGQILQHFGGRIREKHLTNYDLHNSVAKKVNCSTRQIRTYLKRNLKGNPIPLNEPHKIFIEFLAFDEYGVRTQMKNADILRNLNDRFNGDFEIFQVVNYIRSLAMSPKYTLRLR